MKEVTKKIRSNEQGMREGKNKRKGNSGGGGNKEDVIVWKS